MKIRSVVPSDASALADIHKAAFYSRFKTPANEPEVKAYIASANATYFSRLIEEPSSVFLLAHAQEEIFGFAQLNTDKPASGLDQSCFKLERLYVLPELQNKGIGKALLEACLSHRRQEAVSIFWLQVLSSNKEAIALYKQLGFSTFNTSPGKFKADKDHDLWMQDPLSIERWQID